MKQLLISAFRQLPVPKALDEHII